MCVFVAEIVDPVQTRSYTKYLIKKPLVKSSVSSMIQSKIHCLFLVGGRRHQTNWSCVSVSFLLQCTFGSRHSFFPSFFSFPLYRLVYAIAENDDSPYHICMLNTCYCCLYHSLLLLLLLYLISLYIFFIESRKLACFLRAKKIEIARKSNSIQFKCKIITKFRSPLFVFILYSFCSFSTVYAKYTHTKNDTCMFHPFFPLRFFIIGKFRRYPKEIEKRDSDMSNVYLKS